MPMIAGVRRFCSKGVYSLLSLFALTVVSSCGSGQQQTRSDVGDTMLFPNHPEVVVTHVGGNINTPDEEFGLILGSGLHDAYLTSSRQHGMGRQDIYRSRSPRSGSTGAMGSINEVEFVGSSSDTASGRFENVAELNTPENEGCVTFTPDGLTMIFAGAGRKGAVSSDLYIADLENNRWQNVRPIAALNTPGWESHPTLSADGRTLYFISDRSGGFGGQDIYVSTRIGDNWTAPQNLGSTVNTDRDEASPFIAADGTTLYFASNGRRGLGGYDIYVSHNIGGVWTEPQDLGTPINSIDDDMFYTTELGTDQAFVASSRPGSLGHLDIFSVRPNPYESGGVTLVRGVIRDASTGLPVAATVTLTDLKSGKEVSKSRSSDSTGEYALVLQPLHSYSITADAPGYLFRSDSYEITSESNETVFQEVALSPVAGGKTRLLVSFDFNSAVLKPSSLPDLERTVTLLRTTPHMSVTVAGYTDSIGSADANRLLSESRAKAVRDYLISHGIAASRVQAIGYGSIDPVATNSTAEGQAENRRVELQIEQAK